MQFRWRKIKKTKPDQFKVRKNRLKILYGFFVFLLCALAFRLGYIQILWAPELMQKAEAQWTREANLYPVRGAILDRNGQVLAQNANAESIGARPSRINNPREVAGLLAPLLELDETQLYERLKDRSKGHVWIKRQVSIELADAVRELDIRGIELTSEIRRYYPHKQLAAHILGFTKRFAEPDLGIVGQEGIELYYNDKLIGTVGSALRETDLHGRMLNSGETRLSEPLDGYDVVLTIDKVIQHFVEREISNIVSKYSPRKVYAVAMNPNTGEILALANYPTFDPNNPPRDFENFEEMQNFVRNFTVKDNIEPGSTFKVLTAAAALQENVVTQNSTFYCSGFSVVDGQIIRCWKPGGHGHQTFAEAVLNSCNPAFMEMALGLGMDRFFRHMNLFGLGQRTGIDVEGEESGILIPQSRAVNVDLARMGFGQAIALTPIQLLNSVASIINGGNLMRPYLLNEIRKSDSGNEDLAGQDVSLIEKTEPQVIRNVVSEETSRLMAESLEYAVTYGSGRSSFIQGFRVGGKTGTAQKYGPSGEILEDKVISSFIGFAPADDPQIIVLVMVDEPQAEVRFGSIIAAPHAGRIIEDSLRHLGIQPQGDEILDIELSQVEMPNLVGLELSTAVSELRRVNLNFITEGEGRFIAAQVPSYGTKASENSLAILYLTDIEGELPSEQEKLIIVPDLIGKNIREVNGILATVELDMQAIGLGVVVSQNPEAGQSIEAGSSITVEFALPDS